MSAQTLVVASRNQHKLAELADGLPQVQFVTLPVAVELPPEDGDTFVVQAGAEFSVLGRNSLDEMTLSTPAVARDSLIIRTATKLYRISDTGN